MFNRWLFLTKLRWSVTAQNFKYNKINYFKKNDKTDCLRFKGKCHTRISVNLLYLDSTVFFVNLIIYLNGITYY